MHCAFAIEIFYVHTRATRQGYNLTRIIGKIYPTGYKKLFGKATKKRATKNFQLFLITLPVLVNIRVLLPSHRKKP